LRTQALGVTIARGGIGSNNSNAAPAVVSLVDHSPFHFLLYFSLVFCAGLKLGKFVSHFKAIFCIIVPVFV
jgi:hypothetical protein